MILLIEVIVFNFGEWFGCGYVLFLFSLDIEFVFVNFFELKLLLFDWLRLLFFFIG